MWQLVITGVFIVPILLLNVVRGRFALRFTIIGFQMGFLVGMIVFSLIGIQP